MKVELTILEVNMLRDSVRSRIRFVNDFKNIVADNPELLASYDQEEKELNNLYTKIDNMLTVEYILSH